MSKSKAEYIELYGEEAWKEESKRRRSRRNKEKDAAYEEARKGKRNLYFKQRRYKEHLEKVRAERANKEVDPILNEKRRQYYQANKEKSALRHKEYYQKNKDRIREYQKLYMPIYYKEKKEKSPQLLRVNMLTNSYKQSDKKKGFDTSNNITAQWIIENIFTKKCIYCGDVDWQHLGADRIDNSKPHTPDNVVCACGLCNVDRQRMRMSVEEFAEYRKTHPRDFDIHNLQVIEKINGKVVIRKRIA